MKTAMFLVIYSSIDTIKTAISSYLWSLRARQANAASIQSKHQIAKHMSSAIGSLDVIPSPTYTRVLLTFVSAVDIFVFSATPPAASNHVRSR